MSGVLMAMGAMRAAAARMASMETSWVVSMLIAYFSSKFLDRSSLFSAASSQPRISP
jgi:hypothetical protein